MKKITLEEFKALNLDLPNIYQVRSMEKQIELAAEVAKFIPTEVFVEMNEDEQGVFTSVEKTVVAIPHKSLLFTVHYDEYRKKYHINCLSMNDFKDLSFYQVGNVKETLAKPVTMGKLNLKKIQAWITYYEELHAVCAIKNSANSADKQAFIDSLQGLPVKWIGEKRGYINKNGLEFNFQIEENYVRQEIMVRVSGVSNLNIFLAMADNKYTEK